MNKEMPEEIWATSTTWQAGYSHVQCTDARRADRQVAYIRKDKYDALIKRLELDYDYDVDGNPIKIENPENTPDAIDCRDATIKLLEKEISRLNKLIG